MNHSTQLGAWIEGERTHFRVWASKATTVSAVVATSRGMLEIPLRRGEAGMFSGESDQVQAGDRYRYLIDGRATFPDPASRF